jgi:exonuclease VII small subunit
LQTSNAKQVTEYIRQKHQILSHCDAFKRMEKLLSPSNRQAFAERFDTDVLNASLTAEKRIPKYDTPAWSVALTQARKYVSILTKQLTVLKTGIDHHRTLESELQSLPASIAISHNLPQTIEDCSKSLRQAKQSVKEIVTTSTERRDTELQHRITTPNSIARTICTPTRQRHRRRFAKTKKGRSSEIAISETEICTLIEQMPRCHEHRNPPPPSNKPKAL